MELNKTTMKECWMNVRPKWSDHGWREIVPRATLQYKLKELMFDFNDPIESLEWRRNF